MALPFMLVGGERGGDRRVAKGMGLGAREPENRLFYFGRATEHVIPLPTRRTGCSLPRWPPLPIYITSSQ